MNKLSKYNLHFSKYILGEGKEEEKKIHPTLVLVSFKHPIQERTNNT